ICQFAVEDAARTHDGVPLGDAFRRLKSEGADVIGFNCRSGPNAIIRAMETIPRDLGAPLSVFPNAGIADYVDGKVEYKATPEYFAQSALRFADLGARLIGGCCGTTPAHIEAIAGALRAYEPGSPDAGKSGGTAASAGAAAAPEPIVAAETGPAAGRDS